jgi:hypothetical protein
VSQNDLLSCLKAYYTGLPNRAGYILVSADHHHVGKGFSLPKLDDFFLNVTNIVRTFQFFFEETNDTFIIYYHNPGPTASNLPMEMIVFRCGVAACKLVNLRPSDASFVKRTIER